MNAQQIIDAKNLATAMKSKSGNNHSYDYSKIAKDILQLSEIITGLKKFPEKDLKGVQTKVSQFVDCKTKADNTEARVKKTIRKFFQQLDTDCESENKEKSDKANKLLTLLSEYRS